MRIVLLYLVALRTVLLVVEGASVDIPSIGVL